MRLNQVKLIHNGMDITWHSTEEDALRYIKTEIAQANANVRCSLLSDTMVNCTDNIDGCKQVRVIVYQYYTHYMEVFVLKHV